MIVFPVLAHFGVNEILAECCELFLQRLIQRGYDLLASLHDGKSSNTNLSGIYRWAMATDWSTLHNIVASSLILPGAIEFRL
jgi:hypothetical protein